MWSTCHNLISSCRKVQCCQHSSANEYCVWGNFHVWQQWYRNFVAGRTDIHDEGCQGCKRMSTNDLIQWMDHAVWGNYWFTSSILNDSFPLKFQGQLFIPPWMRDFSATNCVWDVFPICCLTIKNTANEHCLNPLGIKQSCSYLD
jgi:hypothetical protein